MKGAARRRNGLETNLSKASGLGPGKGNIICAATPEDIALHLKGLWRLPVQGVQHTYNTGSRPPPEVQGTPAGLTTAGGRAGIGRQLARDGMTAPANRMQCIPD